MSLSWSGLLWRSDHKHLFVTIKKTLLGAQRCKEKVTCITPFLVPNIAHCVYELASFQMSKEIQFTSLIPLFFIIKTQDTEDKNTCYSMCAFLVLSHRCKKEMVCLHLYVWESFPSPIKLFCPCFSEMYLGKWWPRKQENDQGTMSSPHIWHY